MDNNTTFYIVIHTWQSDLENYEIDIKGVATSPEDAQRIFNEYIDEERKIAEESEWVIETDEEDAFYAYNPDFPYSYYTHLYIDEWSNRR